MAKSMYVGVDGTARKVNNMYVGVDGVARKVNKVYVGVDGVARLAYDATAVASDWDVLWEGESELYPGMTLGGTAALVQMDTGKYGIRTPSTTAVSRVLVPYTGIGILEMDVYFASITGGRGWDFGIELRPTAGSRHLIYKQYTGTGLYIEGTYSTFANIVAEQTHTMRLAPDESGTIKFSLDGVSLATTNLRSNTEIAYTGAWFTSINVYITAVRYKHLGE